MDAYEHADQEGKTKERCVRLCTGLYYGYRWAFLVGVFGKVPMEAFSVVFYGDGGEDSIYPNVH